MGRAIAPSDAHRSRLWRNTNDYHAQVGANFLIGMVARALRPGCKVDTMPVLEGAQGIFKSTALAILGGKWFAEVHQSIDSKDFYLALSGKAPA